ncbi:unnamed protein product (macronuclear) [Paramecium tetraurelia]|uniref:Uncharacterized protein n=1 Tax=Paramecium tetraurelia TaxID=5888 RepID=A0DLX7_PARTE|nr:uncharacterized protein GSPATT00018262001 [Paramecium tetraurelia]CAK84044.1 unnamed protein product [Paramecium tetraurelia]|eukprot:XP_001451441.1 hypothetical protein (macronuclear) [Paramecium tetraurelia strain d4-2]
MYNRNNQQLFESFKINELQPHLFLDFNYTLILKNDKMNLVFEELFLRLIDKYEIKIVYILENPENQLFQRGAQLQEFIQKYLGGNKINIQRLNIILNNYQEDLNDRDLILIVQKQMEFIYEKFSKDIFVFRKIKTIEQLQKEFTIEKRSKILTSIFESFQLQLQKDYFTLNYEQAYQLEAIIKMTFISILEKIQVNGMTANQLNQDELKNLKQFYSAILNHTQNTDPLFLCFYSQEWDKLVNETASLNHSDINNYNCLKEILPQFKSIILKSKIFEEVNKMIKSSCQGFNLKCRNLYQR